MSLPRSHRFAALAVVFALAARPLVGAEPEPASLRTSDGRTLTAHLYRGGPHAVVLAHGGVFDKESWRDQAEALVEAGLTALAFDFRGYGDGEPTYGLRGKKWDVLAAIDYLLEAGYERISAVGGSMGAGFVMEASAETDRIDLMVLLAPGSEGEGAGIRARSTLFITAEGDRMRESIDKEYRAAPEPKRMQIFPGTAHAQHIFATEHGAEVSELIVEFLTTE